METFTPVQGFLGGCLIGLAATIYLLVAGRVSGISGYIENVLKPTEPGFPTALAFLVGLPAGAMLVSAILPGPAPTVDMGAGTGLLAVSGLLVGFGARMAGGCTSGHGLSGLARLSTRSFVATAVFMTSAALTVFVTRHLI